MARNTQDTPQFSEEEVKRLAHQYYGISPTSARKLNSECDLNYNLYHIRAVLSTFIHAIDPSSRCEGPTREYVLKISSANEEQQMVDMQNKAMLHLERVCPSVAISRLQRTVDGMETCHVQGSGHQKHLMRLLSFLPGRMFALVKPHDAELLRSLGCAVGTIDAGLMSFSHPAAARVDFRWDLANSLWTRPFLQHISDPARRALVSRHLDAFENAGLPLVGDCQASTPSAPAALSSSPSLLRRSVIHNDANDYNVVVQGRPGSTREIGIIDFGDMVHTCTVFDLAITIAYAVLDLPDPVSAAAHVVAGYHSALPLTEAELSVLHTLVITRLCVSVANSAYQQKVNPENKYLTISERPAWDLLHKLDAVPPLLALCAYRHACGLPPAPTSTPIIAWLRENQQLVGQVTEIDFVKEKPVVFDLSVGSLQIGNLQDLSDSTIFTNKLWSILKASNARVGIGRYNEVRPIYTADLYKKEGNDGPEWRTVHLGLDIFLEPRSPLFAPLDGRVHSVRNNVGAQDYGPTVILEHRLPIGFTLYTLYGHLTEDSLAVHSVGSEVKKGQVIGRIGSPPSNGDWPPHVHFQLILDMLGRQGEFAGVAFPSQRDIWLSLCPDPALLLPGIASLSQPKPGRPLSEMLSDRKEHLGKNLSIAYSRRPLHIVRGYGPYLYDDTGRAFLDAVNNVSHVGHCHPRIIQASAEQMAVLNTNTRYLHENVLEYSRRLRATLPPSLSEANDLALRIAAAHTGRRDVVVLDGAYHGHTAALIDASPYKHDGAGGRGTPPHVHKAPVPDLYRGPHRADDPRAAEKYAAELETITTALQKQGRGPSAFLHESVLGCGGQIVLPPAYLNRAYAAVRAAGGVCIADEVQTGFGRVGSHYWGFQMQGVIPDIVTMGKPIGNGHPLAAVVCTQALADSFNNGMEYFNTFGGNPVSCAVGLAVLDVIEEEKLQEKALSVGNHLMAGVRRLAEKHRLVGDVRGLGLFIGVELVTDRQTREPAAEQASYVAARMRDHAVLLSTDGPHHNVLKIKPPLVFAEQHADFLVSVLDKVLAELEEGDE